MEEPRFIIVVGASAGGFQSILELLTGFTEEMNASVFIVMHATSIAYSDVLVQRMQKNSVFTCKHPEHNEKIRTRHVYLAPADQHMILRRGSILLGHGPVENRWRPSIDVLFRSAAVHYDGRVIGVILSGLLEDGSAGMVTVKACGGTCIVQDPDEAEYPDMPMAVMRYVQVDYCTTLQRISYILNEKTRNGASETHVIPDSIRKEAAIAERVAIGIEKVSELKGERSAYSCPECGGALWEIKEGGLTRYRCHTGHMFTSDELLEQKRKEQETTFWVVLRILEERRNLLFRMAEEEKSKGWNKSAENKSQRASELEVHIDRIKEILFSSTDDPDPNRLQLTGS